MSRPAPEPEEVFRHRFFVPPEAEDANGHVNNVLYVQWMQDVAIRHSDSVGGDEAIRAVGATWVVRAHQIEYLSPAFAGDLIEASTWVSSIERVRSIRQYRFRRERDARLLARGVTEWVFVSALTGRPVAIPEGVRKCFALPTGSEAEDRKSGDREKGEP